MSRSYRRLLLFAVVAALLLAVPATTFANKNLFKARLNTANELHEVVGSNARGAGIFSVTPNGVHFQVQVNNLSGAAVGAHLHGPATESDTGPVVVTLCGGPVPSVTGACITDASGLLQISGTITNQLQPGITNAEFQDMIQAGLLYVNVHTVLNPAGEVRGQVLPH